MTMKKTLALLITVILSASLAACGTQDVSSVILKDNASGSSSQSTAVKSPSGAGQDGSAADASAQASETADEKAAAAAEPEEGTADPAVQEPEEGAADPAVQESEEEAGSGADQESLVLEAAVTSNGAIDASDLFTQRDLTQTADMSQARYAVLEDNTNNTITEEGVYVFGGNASEVTLIVDAADDAKVQIVLDGVNVTNSDCPFIYVKNADKVFVTTTDTENSASVTGAFTPDGETNTDAVIYSRDDLVINGTGSLTIISSDNGISCKDDVKITGGELMIECASDAVEANESVSVSDGAIRISSGGDGIHAENDEDNTVGTVYICGGIIDITAGDDGIHATTIAQIDAGEISASAVEGLEATWIQINGGTIGISASDDGINASQKSNICTPLIEITGGYTTVVMGSGDTDAVDSNGNIRITGGTVDITGQSAFDYDGTAEHTGGTIIVNGQETNEISNQFGGMGHGGMGHGGMPGGGQMPEGGQMPGWFGNEEGTPGSTDFN